MVTDGQTYSTRLHAFVEAMQREGIVVQKMGAARTFLLLYGEERRMLSAYEAAAMEQAACATLVADMKSREQMRREFKELDVPEYEAGEWIDDGWTETVERGSSSPHPLRGAASSFWNTLTSSFH